MSPAVASVATTLSAPRAALRLARAICTLDLSDELTALRRLGIPCTVLSAETDTLTPPERCRKVAELAGGTFEQLDVGGGHVWFLLAAPQLRARLAHH